MREPSDARGRLLDAAESCLRDKGIRATTMASIAERAGMSRAWLYRHFPDKPAILCAVIHRLDNSYAAHAHARIASESTLLERIVAGVGVWREAYDDPGALPLRLRSREPSEYEACAGRGVQDLVPDVAAFWRRYVVDAVESGEIGPGLDIEEGAEWIARALMSIASAPGRTLDADDPDAVRSYVARFVLPGVVTSSDIIAEMCASRSG